jgi:hypothetical protein
MSIVIRSTPGIDATGSVRLSPSITKIGQMKSAALRWFSDTIARAQGACRVRRIRVRG